MCVLWARAPPSLPRGVARTMARVLHQNANRPKILSNGLKNDKPTLIVFAQQSLMGRRAAKCVDLHAHDHEERGEEGPFVAGHRVPRRAISPRPRTGHPPEHRRMGAAVEQAKGKGGGGGCSAPTWRACRRGLGGTTPRPHCWRHRPTQ